MKRTVLEPAQLSRGRPQYMKARFVSAGGLGMRALIFEQLASYDVVRRIGVGRSNSPTGPPGPGHPPASGSRRSVTRRAANGRARSA